MWRVEGCQVGQCVQGCVWLATEGWEVPAFAGMTRLGAGMTCAGGGMTETETGMTGQGGNN